jgi:hypothetical protein
MASNSVENAQNTESKREVARKHAQGHNTNIPAERGLDKTIADSFPTSDPPSSIPDPGHHHAAHAHRKQLEGLTPGTWAALSLDDDTVIATGPARDEVEHQAREKGHKIFELVCVPGSRNSNAA